MAIKKVRERIHNGGTTGTEADYDVIYYETSEDLLVGQIQALNNSGYRILPGGLILQWGSIVATTSGYNFESTITLPIEVNSMIMPILSCYDMQNQVVVSAHESSNKNFKVKAKSVVPANGTGLGIGTLRICWFAICK